jgi:hypothetical protein
MSTSPAKATERGELDAYRCVPPANRTCGGRQGAGINHHGRKGHRATYAVTMFCKLLLASCLCGGLMTPGHAQDGQEQAGLHRHPPQDQLLHEKFYSTWRMPDNPSASCCNNADCYPAEIKYVDGNIYAKRREDGKYILVPSEKVERNRDNPDGRNHLCAPPPNAFHSSDTVFCFALGGAT